MREIWGCHRCGEAFTGPAKCACDRATDAAKAEAKPVTNEGTNCRACEDAIRALSPMPVPKHRMYRVTNEQTWEEP